LAIGGRTEWWGGGEKVTQHTLLHADMVFEHSNELAIVVVQYSWEEP